MPIKRDKTVSSNITSNNPPDTVNVGDIDEHNFVDKMPQQALSSTKPPNFEMPYKQPVKPTKLESTHKKSSVMIGPRGQIAQTLKYAQKPTDQSQGM